MIALFQILHRNFTDFFFKFIPPCCQYLLCPFYNLVATEAILDVVRSAVLGSVLILTTIVLVVELLSILLGTVLGPFAVDPVGALGLGELVDLGAGEASEELLGEGVGDVLALLALVVLKGLECGKGGSAGEELVAEAGLVVA